MEAPRKLLESELGSALKLVEPLAPATVLGVGGPADFFFEAKTIDDLIRAVASARKAKLPFTVLGSGSAILVSDVGYHGLVIKNSAEGIEEIATDSPHTAYVEVTSGTSLPKLVRFSLEHNLSGLAAMASKSGTVGGALVWNTEAGGERISDNLESLKVVDIIGQLRTVPKPDGQFDAGTSRFMGREEVILSAKFKLLRAGHGQVSHEAGVAMERSSDEPREPRIMRLFKYLHGESPERLIGAVGLAGYREGGAHLLESNPNYVQNLGHATTDNVIALIKLASQRVKEKYHTDLRPDFLYLGPE